MLDFTTTHPIGTALTLIILALTLIIQGITILTILKQIRNLNHLTQQLAKNQKFLNQVYNADMPIPPVPAIDLLHSPPTTPAPQTPPSDGVRRSIA